MYLSQGGKLLVTQRPSDRQQEVLNQYLSRLEDVLQSDVLKCQRLLGPKFRKVKTSFFPEIRQVLNTLMPSEGVCDYTPV